MPKQFFTGYSHAIGNESSFTQSEILLAMRNKKLGKSERLLKAMSVLGGRNIISAPIKLLTTRKPTTIYHVNPMILSAAPRSNLQ